jgi:hypothetical protein
LTGILTNSQLVNPDGRSINRETMGGMPSPRSGVGMSYMLTRLSRDSIPAIKSL